MKKPLYWLDDASWMFRLKLEDTLVNIRMKVMRGHKAFYFMHDKDRELMGAVLTHVDDFIIAGNEKFVEMIKV